MVVMGSGRARRCVVVSAVALVAACASRDSGTTEIAPAAPAGNAASRVDGGLPVSVEPAAITVNVASSTGAGLANARVFFVDTMSGARVTAMTNATGDARIAATHATDVTVAFEDTSGRRLVSAVGVGPGQSLRIAAVGDSALLSGQVNVNIDEVGGFAKAAFYNFDFGVSCFSGTTGNTLPASSNGELLASCTDGGRAPVLLVARAGSMADAPLGFAIKTLTPAAMATPVDASNGDWTAAAAPRDATFTGTAPSWASTAVFAASFVSAHGERYLTQLRQPSPNSLAASYTVAPATLAPTLVASLQLTAESGAFVTRYIRGDSAAAVTFDVGSYLAAFTSASVDGSGLAPRVTYAATTALPAGLLARVRLKGTRAVGDASVAKETRWTIVAATSPANSVLAPELPADLADYAPSAAWTLTQIEVSNATLGAAASAPDVGFGTATLGATAGSGVVDVSSRLFE